MDVEVDAFRGGQQEWRWLTPGGLNLLVQIGGEVHKREPMGKSRGCGGRWTWTRPWTCCTPLPGAAQWS